MRLFEAQLRDAVADPGQIPNPDALGYVAV
jgi:hypothetical protein